MEEKDDFLKHIKETLLQHEERYDDGAWERFSAKNMAAPAGAKKIIPIWKWAVAAAAIVTGIIFTARYFNNADVPNNKSGQPYIVNKKNTITDTLNITPRQDSILQKNKITIPLLPLPENYITAKTYNSTIIINSKRLNTAVTNYIKAPAPLVITQQPGTISSDNNNNDIDFWKNRVIEQQPENVPQEHSRPPLLATTNTPAKGDEKNKKWISSLYVSPVFGEAGVNMGYGYSLGYAINKKIRISSGIAHTKISASRSYNMQPAYSSPSVMANNSPLMAMSSFAATVPATTTLQSVQGVVSGIDIPVEVNYSINKKVYAAAGVSGLVIINNNNKYTYVDSRNVRVTVETSKGDTKENKLVNLENYATTNAPLQAQEEQTAFLGFYNVSVGYRQKISPKNAVSLEPFIKIPMRQLTGQNLNYTGMGVKLKVDF